VAKEVRERLPDIEPHMGMCGRSIVDTKSGTDLAVSAKALPSAWTRPADSLPTIHGTSEPIFTSY